jgi:hypothetical protein
MIMNIKFRIKRLYKLIMRSVYYPKWWYQRVTRGFSDRDMWNADNYLAGVFAGVLQWYVNKGIGVSMAYASEDDPNGENLDDMVARRDADYLFYASIFEEYKDNGPAYNEEWQKLFGGVLDEDIKAALQWLSEHFTELWD